MDRNQPRRTGQGQPVGNRRRQLTEINKIEPHEDEDYDEEELEDSRVRLTGRGKKRPPQEERGEQDVKKQRKDALARMRRWEIATRRVFQTTRDGRIEVVHRIDPITGQAPTKAQMSINNRLAAYMEFEKETNLRAAPWLSRDRWAAYLGGGARARVLDVDGDEEMPDVVVQRGPRAQPPLLDNPVDPALLAPRYLGLDLSQNLSMSASPADSRRWASSQGSWVMQKPHAMGHGRGTGWACVACRPPNGNVLAACNTERICNNQLCKIFGVCFGFKYPAVPPAGVTAGNPIQFAYAAMLPRIAQALEIKPHEPGYARGERLIKRRTYEELEQVIDEELRPRAWEAERERWRGMSHNTLRNALLAGPADVADNGLDD